MVFTKKFSEFDDADLGDQDNELVGLSNGLNAKSSKVIVWTTATRPLTPFDGLLGYNTNLNQYEYYDDSIPDWVQLESSDDLFIWNMVTAASANMITDNGYVANNSAQVNLTLPLVADFGQEIKVMGFGTGGWRISQRAGQNIIFGNVQTTVGAGGSLESTLPSDLVQLLCIVPNLVFKVTGAGGDLTYV